MSFLRPLGSTVQLPLPSLSVAKPGAPGLAQVLVLARAMETLLGTRFS